MIVEKVKMSYHFIHYEYFVNLFSKNDAAGLCQEKKYININQNYWGIFCAEALGDKIPPAFFYWPIMVLYKEEKASVKTALLETHHW